MTDSMTHTTLVFFVLVALVAGMTIASMLRRR